MANIEKIKAEMERRKKRWMYDNLPIAMGRYYEDRDLLAFIDSLPEEFPPYCTGFKGDPDPAGTSDLEEAALEYIQGALCDLDDGPTVGLAKEAFIAGAEWQRIQDAARRK